MEPRFKNVHIPRVALLAYFNHYAGGDNIALPVFKDAALYDLEGAYVVEIQNDPSTRSLLLTLWRKDWPEIPEGQVIPEEPGMYLMEEEVRQLVPSGDTLQPSGDTPKRKPGRPRKEQVLADG